MARELIELQLPSGEIIDFDVPAGLDDAQINALAVKNGLFESAPAAPAPDGAGQPVLEDAPAFDEQSKPETEPAPSLGERFMRQQELGTRAVARGSVGVIGDAVVQAMNVVPGVDMMLPTEAVDSQLTRIGFAVPETPGEKLAGRAIEFGAGAISGMAGATTLPARMASQMTAQATSQVVGGVVAGGAVEAAAQAGVGPWGQLAIGLMGGVGGAVVHQTGATKYGKWADNRMESGVPMTVKELEVVSKAHGVDMNPEQLDQLATAMNKLQDSAKVEAATIDLIHNPKTAMSITDTAKGKKRVLTKEEKEIRKEIRKAFGEDPESADHMARRAAEMDGDRALRAQAIAEEGIERVRAREALERRHGPVGSPISRTADKQIVAEIQARQEAMLARLEQKSVDAQNPSVAQLRENADARQLQNDEALSTLKRNPRTIRNADGDIRKSQTFGQKLIKRVDQIAPRLATGLRRVDIQSGRRTNLAVEAMGDWFNNKSITKAFKKNPTFRAAVGNADRALMDRMVPGSAAIYDRVVVPRLQMQARVLKENGQNVLDDMHPREVLDVNGLRAALGREERTKLDEALDLARKENSHRDLNEDQIANVVGRIIGGKPLRQDLSRRIKEVTDDTEKFYVNPRNALIDSIHKFERNVATKDFYRNTLGDDIEFGQAAPDGTVSKVLARSMEAGDLSSSDVQEAARLVSIALREGRQGASKAIRAAKKGITLATLGGNVFASITQLGDPFINIARFGTSSLKSMFGRNGDIVADAYNAGVRELSHEARTEKRLNNVLRKSLEVSGFAGLDKKFSKQATVAAMIKRKKQLAKDPEGFERDMKELFGDRDGLKLVDDIRNNRMSDDMAVLVANDVADVRPLGVIDMPVHFAKNPNGRLAYSLLSWSINQLNFSRNNAINLIEQGINRGDKALIAKGTKNLALMATMFAAGGGTAAVIKDQIRALMQGEPVPDPVDSFGKGAMAGAVPFGVTGKMAIEGALTGRGSAAELLPAVGVINSGVNAIGKFMATGDLEPLIKSVGFGRALWDLVLGTFIGDAEASTKKFDPSRIKNLSKQSAPLQSGPLPEGTTDLPPGITATDRDTARLQQRTVQEIEAEQAARGEQSLPEPKSSKVADHFKAAKEHLELREGNESSVYQNEIADGQGGTKLDAPTAGIGHVLSEAEQRLYPVGTKVPQDVRDAWFKKDSAEAFAAATRQAKAIGRPDMVAALASVNFQLGTGWTTKHPSTWEFMKQKDWTSAAAESADSLWYVQTPTRVEDLQKALLKGIKD